MTGSIDLRQDGHTHSPWCPHGSDRPLDDYLEQAVALGFERYAVTEHIPLPDGFFDPLGPYECAPHPDVLDAYLAGVEDAKARWAGRIDVLVGLEIDYLGAAQGGWHGDLLRRLDAIWDRLDPAATLLSVHFIDGTLVDGTPELTAALVPPGEPNDAYHLRYYAVLEAALGASWRWRGRDLRPRRVAHLTLPRKFIRALPLREPERVLDAATRVLERVAREGLELDLNTAGLDKPWCGETYLPEPLLTRARELGIPLVFGSDAHAPEEVGRHLDHCRRATSSN